MEKELQNANEIPQYSQYLSQMLDELCISQSQLGKAVRRSQKTISRYVLGKSLPDNETREAIGKFIQKQSVFNGFQHIPSEEFAQLLGSLLDEFKERITQEQLAQKIGKYQKDISRYLHCTAKPDTKTQYDILNVFYELCQVKNGLLISAYADTGSYLRNLLERDFFNDMLSCLGGALPYLTSPDYWSDEEIIDKQGAPEAFVQYCMTLPYGQQQLIEFHFWELAGTMNLFRQLSPMGQRTALDELEKDAFVGFPETEHEHIFFRQITAYRKVILANLTGPGVPQSMAANPRQQERLLLSFQSYYADLYWFGADDMIEELEYKLQMTQKEWYLWMLLLIYGFKGKNLTLFRNRLSEMLYATD